MLISKSTYQNTCKFIKRLISKILVSKNIVVYLCGGHGPKSEQVKQSLKKSTSQRFLKVKGGKALTFRGVGTAES